MASGLPSPIKVKVLSDMLTNYDPILAAELTKGFENGFDMGFRGVPNNDEKVRNHRSALENPNIVDVNLQKEIIAGRISGPFSSPPFKNFQISPIGLVPKSEPNSFRMIIDLSHPSTDSINDNIHDVFAEVNYSSLSDAIKLVIEVGKGAFMAKTDIEKAFRILPLQPEQYHLVCYKWNNLYYHDKAMVMGCRSSCSLFEKFSTSLEFIA